MIHIMSSGGPHKGLESFVARFYLAQFLMNDCTVFWTLPHSQAHLMAQSV